MDRIHVRDLRRADHLGNIQVTIAAPRWPDANRLVRKTNVKRVAVSFGIDGDCRNPKFLTCGQYSKGNLAAIGDQNFSEHFAWRTSAYFFPSGRMPKSGSPYSTGWPFSTNTLTTSPATSDSISFINFIASMMQSACPDSTRAPTFTNG